jgi:hypothetical protein
MFQPEHWSWGESQNEVEERQILTRPPDLPRFMSEKGLLEPVRQPWDGFQKIVIDHHHRE